jgi:MerR family redox-sensitive transcriptional activator SoxR
MSENLGIGAFGKRAGVAASALRFYEDAGLITSTRSEGGQRTYARGELRRVAFIKVAQNVGLSLEEIRAALASLPAHRTPTKQDWEKLSRTWQPRIEAQIAQLVALRDQLSSCIGCGCLSLRSCALYNPGDQAAAHGKGPRYLLGDRAPVPSGQAKAAKA